MTKRTWLIPATLAALLAGPLVSGGLAGVAHAKENGSDTRDAAALQGMSMSLTQAITTAEQSGGHAAGADLVQDHGATKVSVELVGPKGVHTVLVDGKTGHVTAAPADSEDAADND